MADPFVGEIRIVAFNFAPKGWAFCSGQILPLSQNTALFSLLGTTYGGDGKSTFALPDLRDRAPMHSGQGAGLTYRDLGEAGGSSTVTLVTTELPAHNHTISSKVTAGNLANPMGNIWAGGAGRTPPPMYQNGAANTTMNDAAVGSSGGDQPHNNRQPYLGMSFIIALQGVFPSRT